jgi:hypothetical protein
MVRDGDGLTVEVKGWSLVTFEEKLRFAAAKFVALHAARGEGREAIRRAILDIAVEQAGGAPEGEYDREAVLTMCRRAVDAALDDAGL